MTESKTSKSKKPDEHAPDSSEDHKLGVGVAPTEPGDAGEGNPGTKFQTTEEIEKADLSKSGDVGGVR
jgi:hypothetical protein